MIGKAKRCFKWMVAYVLAVPLSLFLAVMIMAAFTGMALVLFHALAERVYDNLEEF